MAIVSTYQLLDEGTMDTVVKCQHGELVEIFRYATDVAYDYRDDDGLLDMVGFIAEVVQPDFDQLLAEDGIK
jgi:hypothetical protein